MVSHNRLRLTSYVVILALLFALLPQRTAFSAASGRQEVPELRTENAKAYRTSEGLEYEVYPKKIHYRDANGSFKEMDQFLKWFPGKQRFATDAMPFEVSFSNETASNDINFRYGQTGVRFQLDPSLGKGEFAVHQFGNGLTFRRGDDVEYDYHVQDNGLKESILLRRPTDRSVFRFPIQLDGVQPIAEPDGSISAVDDNGKVAWRLAAPFAKDASGARAPSVTQKVDVDGETTYLTISVDPAWLADKSRKYPIEIDPTVLIEPDPADGMDVILKESGACRDLVGYREMTCGTTTDLYEGLGLLKFNLSGLPAGARIDSALLRFFVTEVGGLNVNASLQPITREWEKQSVAYYDAYDKLAPAVATVPVVAKTWAEGDITSLVNQWLTRERPNFGVAVTVTTYGTDRWLNYNSSTGSDLTSVPHLILKLTLDQAAPSISINTPLSNGSVTGLMDVDVAATDAAPGALERVEAYVDDQLTGVAEGEPASGHRVLKGIAGLSAGSHTLRVRALDRAGYEATQTIPFSFDSTPVPSSVSTMGIGNGKVQVAWPSLPGTYTYNIYRSTSRVFTLSPESRIASGLAASTFVDQTAVVGTTYYYRVTAVNNGAESDGSVAAPAVSTAVPSLTLAYSGATESASGLTALSEGAFAPASQLRPESPYWRHVTAANESLADRDGIGFVSQSNMPWLVKGQLLTFDVLSGINRHRTTLGAPQVNSNDLRSLMSALTLQWVGFGSGSASGNSSTNGAKLQLWNNLNARYDLDASNSAASPSALTIQADATQAGQHFDGGGMVQALVQPAYSAGTSVPAVVTSDYALLTVTFTSQAPTRLDAATMGNGRVLLTWKPSAFQYRVYRSTFADFVPSDATKLAEIGGAYFVDAPPPVEAGTVYYYKVAAVLPEGPVFSDSAAVAPDPGTAVYLARPTSAYHTDGYSVLSFTAAEYTAVSQPDGSLAVTNLTNGPTKQVFTWDVLAAVRTQLGQPSLDVNGLRSMLSAFTVDWSGYGTRAGAAADAVVEAINPSGQPQALGTVHGTTPGRVSASISTQASQYLTSTGTLQVQVRTVASGYPQQTATDHVHLYLTLKPSGFTATVSSSNQPTITWANAGNFNVYRSVVSGTGYLWQGTSSYSFYDRTVEYGRTYYYVGRIIRPDGTEGPPSPEVSVTTLPVVKPDSDAQYTGSWSDVGDAAATNSTYKRASSSSANSASYTFMGSGVGYVAAKACFGSVTVQLDGVSRGTFSLYADSPVYSALIFSDTNLTWGQHSLVISGVASSSCSSMNVDGFKVWESKRPAPQGVSATPNNGQVTVQWTPAAGATGYHIYRSTTSGTMYRRLTATPVTGTSWTDTAPLDQQTYYVVTAMYNGQAGTNSGNETAPSSETATLAGVGRYAGNNWQVAPAGQWTTVDTATALAGKLSTASTSGAGLTLNFAGGGFRVVGTKGPQYGIMDVYLNGQRVASVDEYSPSVLARQELFKLEGLTGNQTVEVRYTGNKNASATAAAVNLEAFEVTPGDRPWFLEGAVNGAGVNLTWTGTSAAFLGYYVDRATVSGGPYTRLTATPVTGTSFSDASPSAGTYYYVVYGVKTDGTLTPASNEAAVSMSRLGLDGRWPYVSVPWASATGYIQVQTGNFVLPVTDAVIPAGRLAVALRRTYNSGDTARHSLGLGWRLNAQQELQDNGSAVTWIDGDGSASVFTLQPDGTYLPEAQVFATLQKNPDGTWEIQSKEGQRYLFDAGGRLTAVADRNQNRIDYTLDAAGRITAMVPSSGGPWTLTYDPATNLLTTVTDGAGRVYGFGYDADGRLTTATDATGAATTYGYSTGGLLTGVTDPEGRTAALVFDSGRVVRYLDGLSKTTSFAYGANRTTVTDPLGNDTVFVVTADGRLAQTVNALNGVTAMAYDSAGNLVQVTDPLGRITQISQYDAWGNPGKIVDALNGTTLVQYDAVLHLVTQTTDALGHTATVAYDQAGNPTKVAAALGTSDEQVTRYTYDARGLRLTAVDPRAPEGGAGYTTSYEYDERGWLTKLTDPLGGATTLQYDAAGNLTVQTDPLGRATRFTYDLAGRRVLTVYADGAVETVQYDRTGRVVKTVDPTKVQAIMVYDPAGRPLSVTDALGATTSYTYDDAGRRTKVTDPLGNTTVTVYDALDRPISVTNPEGESTYYQYDTVGNVTVVTQPDGYKMTATYDALNRMVTLSQPPATTRYEYDAVGNLLTEKDPAGNWTRYEYDNLNRLSNVYDALNLDTTGKAIAGAKKTHYQYDKAGNKTAVEDPLTNKTSYAYDALNRMVQETSPMGDLQQYVFDAAGQVTESIDGNGVIMLYGYDLRGRVTYLGHPDDCRKQTYTYDLAGRKLTATNRVGMTVYEYDEAGRLVADTDPFGNTVRYRYDSAGRRTSMTIKEGTWSYGYDRAGRLTSVTDHEGHSTTYSYTADGRVLQVSRPGITLQNSYDSYDRLVKQTYGASTLIFNYQYDVKGNVTSITSTGLTTTDVTYKYDALNRLVESAPSSRSVVTAYTYDAAGNRLTRAVTKVSTTTGLPGTAATDTFNYDKANRISSVTRDKATTERYVYDGAGRLIVVDGYDLTANQPINARYQYDAFGNLEQVAKGNTVTFYGYDADGRRLYQKTLNRAATTTGNTVYYQYDGAQVVAERDGAGATQAVVTRGLGGELLTLDKPGISSPYLYLLDRLGSVVELVDSTLAVQNFYTYDDFGIPTAPRENVQNDWKFTGAIWDGAASLYQLGARYYQPKDGRFITQDTYKGSPWQPWTQNLYTYVGNNPVNYIDPTGHSACSPTDEAAGDCKHSEMAKEDTAAATAAQQATPVPQQTSMQPIGDYRLIGYSDGSWVIVDKDGNRVNLVHGYGGGSQGLLDTNADKVLMFLWKQAIGTAAGAPGGIPGMIVGNAVAYSVDGALVLPQPGTYHFNVMWVIDHRLADPSQMLADQQITYGYADFGIASNGALYIYHSGLTTTVLTKGDAQGTFGVTPIAK